MQSQPKLSNRAAFLFVSPLLLSSAIASAQFLHTQQAESYSSTNGMGSYEGYYLGSINQGDTATYGQITIPATDDYTINWRHAGYGGGYLELRLDGTLYGYSPDLGHSSGWTNWATLSNTINLPAGTYTLSLGVYSGGDYNLDWFEIEGTGSSSSTSSTSSSSTSSSSSSSSSSSGGQSPYLGSAVSIPGTVMAQYYDLGGAGVAYNDSDSINEGGCLRSDGVDMEAASIGDCNIGWVQVGEWMEYTIDVAAAGDYDISAQIAGFGGTVHFEFTGATTVSSSTLNLPSMGGWQTWGNSGTTQVTLNAGEHVVRLVQDGGSANIRSFDIQEASQTPPGTTVRVASFNIFGWNKLPGSDGYTAPYGSTSYNSANTYAANALAQGPDVVVIQEGVHDDNLPTSQMDWVGYWAPKDNNQTYPNGMYRRAMIILDHLNAQDGGCWQRYRQTMINTCKGNSFASTNLFDLQDSQYIRTGEKVTINKDGKQYSVINIHWDHTSSSVTQTNANQTAAAVNSLGSTPTVTTGDLNTSCNGSIANSFASGSGSSLIQNSGIDCLFTKGISSPVGWQFNNAPSDHAWGTAVEFTLP